MKIKRFNESSDISYYKELGYDKSVLDYLAASYQLWTDAEGLPELSADEQHSDKLTDEQNKYLVAFMNLWDLTEDFESKYSQTNFVAGKIVKKYNL